VNGAGPIYLSLDQFQEQSRIRAALAELDYRQLDGKQLMELKKTNPMGY
jgi:hypothetical protein